jgi:maltooligosyltrehalose synthase
VLPEGRWIEVLTGRAHQGGSIQLGTLMVELPVALLVRQT